MLKKLFILLFTIFISSNLFAENHDIHKQIADIRLDIQEIKLLDARDEREKKIEKLEADLKEIDEKFSQNNINKKELEKSFENTKEIVERQDIRLENLNYYFFWYGILITILLFGISYISYRFTSNHVNDIVNDWIEKNKENVLEPIRSEAKDLQSKIEERALVLYKEQLKEYKIDDKLDESQKESKKEILEKVNEILEKKEKEEYTYSDWYSKYLTLDNQKKYTRALIFLEKALKHAVSDEEISQSLFSKALLYQNMKTEEFLIKSIDIYDELIEKFFNASTSSIEMRVLSSLYNKGLAQSNISKESESFSTYNLLIDKYKNTSNPDILRRLSKTLINKFELNILFNYDNSTDDKELFNKISKNDEQTMLQYDMLNIFKKSRNENQDNEINIWKEKYKYMSMEQWTFKELKSWADSFSEKETKERIIKYIEIFENHKKETVS